MIQAGTSLESMTQKARQTFARNLRVARLAKGLSQEDLADIAGLHRTFVGAVERGETNVSVDNIERLADALDVSIQELFREEAS